MAGVVTEPKLFLTKEKQDAKRGEVIHSGHFMISSVADQDEVDDDDTHDRDSPVHHDQAIRLREGYDFSEVRKETQNTYQFGHRSTNQITIDASLARLFECMSLAYRGGKVVSPKWKNFKGMRLSVKDKIRLNNAIWRTWHIEYIMKRKRNKISFVQFATPLDNESDCDSHSKPEAVVMEGKYWKRRIETVVAEYKKWRAFFMEKLQQSDHPGLTWVSNQSMPSTPDSMYSNMDALMKDDAMFTDLADKLFRGLSQPFQFPNPREIAQHATNSDMMQPGLLQLQPPIDDFMDPLDTLQDIFSPTRKSPNLNSSNSVSLFYSSSNNVQSSVAQLDFPTPMFTPQDFNTPCMPESTLEELVQRATAGHDALLGEDLHRMTPPRPIPPSQPPQTTTQITQLDTPMQVQQTNNYRISDPMLNKPVQDQMFTPVQNNTMGTTVPMMISKQQQATPTVSQVVMSRPHQQQQHQHHQLSDMSAYSNTVQPKSTMPPPQKVAPRRRSTNKPQNIAPAQNLVTLPIQVMPQAKSVADVPMIVNYPPTATNAPQMPQARFPAAMQEVAIPPLIEQQPMQMQVDKTPQQTQQMVMQTVEPLPQNLSIENLHTQAVNSASRGSKDAHNRQAAPIIIPATIPQTMPNLIVNSSERVPTRKQVFVGQPLPNSSIVVKQPSQTILNSQHIAAKQQTMLTQLLTSGRQEGSKSSTHLQAPPHVLITPGREAQLKQVREQAANFNTFQNSVLMAAAQMAASPQQLTSPTDSNVQNMTVSPQAAANTSSTVSPKLFVSKNRRIDMKDTKQQWILPFVPSTTKVVSMDTDDDSCRSKEDFVNQMEEKSYNESLAGASSSSGQRPQHFTAEQKRRCNIKALCDRLQEIVPEISNHPNQKISKAVLLNKSCNHIKNLQAARQQTAAEIQELKKRIEALNEDISNFQQQLPATGVPVSRRRGDRMRAIFDDWVRDRTLTDWKFFIFSMIIKPWFLTYDETVSTASIDELCKSCIMWLEKNCSLLTLRKGVVDSLQELGTTTNILTDPGTLQQQAEHAVKQGSSRPGTSSS